MPAGPYADTSTDSAYSRIRYPNPFFDLSREYIPKNIKTLFKYCKTFFYTNGFIRNVITKLTEYPITDILYESNVDPEVKDRYQELFNHHIKLKTRLIEIGLDYYTYGNVFISINTRFRRFLVCESCETRLPIENVQYKFKKYLFQGICPKCSSANSDFKVEDVSIKSPEGLNLIRWDPNNIEIDFDELTHESRYFYTMTDKRKRAIISGKREILNHTPLIFIEALKKRKKIELDRSNLYHFKRPTLAEDDMGWGKPMLLAAMKDIYYLQTLRRGNEAIAQEHIVPKKCVFPQSMGQMDPYCVDPETPMLVRRAGVLMTLEARDVQIGDETLNKEGTWAEIGNKRLRALDDEERAYTLEVHGLEGMRYNLSEGHPFWARSSRAESPEWVKTRDLSKKHYVGYNTTWERVDASALDLKTVTNRKTVTDKYIYKAATRKYAGILEWTEKVVGDGIVYPSRTLVKKLRSEEAWTRKNVEKFQQNWNKRGVYQRVARKLPLTDNTLLCLGIATGGKFEVTGGAVKCAWKKTKLIKVRLEKLSAVLKKLVFKDTLLEIVETDDEIYIAALKGSIFYELVSGLREGLSTEIYNLPNTKLRHFVRGYWEQVGSKTECAFNNLALANQVRNILASSGVITRLLKGATGYKLRLVSPRAALNQFFAGGVTDISCEDTNFFFENNILYSKIKKRQENVKLDKVIGFYVPDGNSFSVVGLTPKNTQMNLGRWRSNVEEQLRIWKRDSNHIAVFPIPMGYQELGGTAKALLLTPEAKFLEESIVNGLGVPLEFIKGGASWTGSSVSLRIIENHFLTYRELMLDFLNFFLIPQINKHLGYPKIKIKFKKFKMADDAESKQLALNLNASGKLADTQLLDEFGFDIPEALEALEKSTEISTQQAIKTQEGLAEAQGRAQMILAKYQARAQNEMVQEQHRLKEQLFRDELAAENAEIRELEVTTIVDRYAAELSLMDEMSQKKYLDQLRKQKPITAGLVLDRLLSMIAPMSEVPAADVSGQQAKGYTKKDEVRTTNQDKAHGPTRGSP